ncbi:MAG: LPS-assembly protein LptD [Crocinitomicaceae bacterium]|nr:LPS-assembly protein LptD [Crocinitomicaceae bacterium]
MLIITIVNVGYSQDTVEVDTTSYIRPVLKDSVKIDEESLETPIKYDARDSIITDLQKEIVYLYGEAVVVYGDIKLTADMMIVDMNKKEVQATYSLDSLGQPVGKPHFTQGSEEFIADSIRYNIETKKGYIREVRSQYDEFYVQMNQSKRHPNGEIHLKDGKISTCELEDPHYHFHLTNAVIVPEKRIVSGPVNIWVNDVPTPVGLPFGFFPIVQRKKHGILIPEIVPTSQYGFGLKDFGYYIPLGEKVETSFYGTIYTKGTWGVRNQTNYLSRYKFSGSVDLRFDQFKEPWPSTNKINKFSIYWRHQQKPTANPYWRFNADVKFQSDNNTKNSTDINNPLYFNNTLYSSITVNRLFPGTPFSMSMKAGLNQNSQTGNFILDIPTYNFTMNRVFIPFRSKAKRAISSKWYDKIGVTYNLTFQNQATVNDSLFNPSNENYSSDYLKFIPDRFLNGIRHTANINTTVKLFKGALNFNPTIAYNGRINFQYINKYWDNDLQEQVIDTLKGFGYSHDISFNGALTTSLYGYYKAKNGTTLRHELNPSISFTYRPDMGNFRTEYVGTSGELQTWSPYERSLYREPGAGQYGAVSYAFRNNFQMKVRSKKDTITGFKKIKILDRANITGSYNIFLDSLNFSDIKFDFASTPLPFLNLIAGFSLSPYGYDKTTGRVVNEWVLKQNNKLALMTRANASAVFTITSKKSREKMKDIDRKYGTSWDSDINYVMSHPGEYIDFAIPWKINISYNFNFTRPSTNLDTFNIIQTMRFTGDFNITKKWKIGFTGNVNFSDPKDITLTNLTLDLYRDLHCWELSFHWIPIGGNSAFYVKINIKATTLKDLKYELRKPPEFF